MFKCAHDFCSNKSFIAFLARRSKIQAYSFVKGESEKMNSEDLSECARLLRFLIANLDSLNHNIDVGPPLFSQSKEASPSSSTARRLMIRSSKTKKTNSEFQENGRPIWRSEQYA